MEGQEVCDDILKCSEIEFECDRNLFHGLCIYRESYRASCVHPLWHCAEIPYLTGIHNVPLHRIQNP